MNVDQLVVEKYDQLPRGQKKIADYLMSDPVEFSISTVAQIAKKVNMSETTVIRLAYTIGFESFSQMQRNLQKQFINSSTTASPVEPSVLHAEEKTSEANLFEQVVNEDLQMVKSILETIDRKSVWEAIDLLMGAEEVKVGGYLASYSVAHWFSLKLGMMRENVTLLSNDSNSLFDSLISENGSKVVYFLISMPSYAADTQRIGRIAKEQGSKIIALTDRRLSPVGRLADICLTIGLGVQSRSVISVTPVMSYLNLIASGIEWKYRDVISERVQKISDVYSRENIVIE